MTPSRFYGASVIWFHDASASAMSLSDFQLGRVFWISDRWPINGAVVMVIVLDTAQHDLILRLTYEYVVSDFANFLLLELDSKWLTDSFTLYMTTHDYQQVSLRAGHLYSSSVLSHKVYSCIVSSTVSLRRQGKMLQSVAAVVIWSEHLEMMGECCRLLRRKGTKRACLIRLVRMM